MTNEEIKAHILKNGVRNLVDFGYPSCDSENIMTDPVYSEFFKSALKENLGQSTKQVDSVINELLSQIP
jgi:hypothetical protein